MIDRRGTSGFVRVDAQGKTHREEIASSPLTLDGLRRAKRAIEKADRIGRERWAEWNKLTPEEQRELMARPLPLRDDQKAALDRLADEIARELFR